MQFLAATTDHICERKIRNRIYILMSYPLPHYQSNIVQHPSFSYPHDSSEVSSTPLFIHHAQNPNNPTAKPPTTAPKNPGAIPPAAPVAIATDVVAKAVPENPVAVVPVGAGGVNVALCARDEEMITDSEVAVERIGPAVVG